MSTKTKTAKTETAPKTEPKTAKTEPMNAATCDKYTPAARAIVAQVCEAARSAASATMTLAGRLAEAMSMNLHTVTGHADTNAWAWSVLMTAAPNAGRSTIYAWVEVAHGIVGVRKSGEDLAIFPTDTLRQIGSKSTAGQNPEQMASLAKELAQDPALRNARGNIDPAKVRTALAGETVKSGKPDLDTLAKRLASRARKLNGRTRDGAIELLTAALAHAKRMKK
jgi:hypothetical protein